MNTRLLRTICVFVIGLLCSFTLIAGKPVIGKPSNTIDWQSLLQLQQFELGNIRDNQAVTQHVAEHAPVPAPVAMNLDTHAYSFNSELYDYEQSNIHQSDIGVYKNLNTQNKIGVNYNFSNFDLTPNEHDFTGYHSKGISLRLVVAF